MRTTTRTLAALAATACFTATWQPTGHADPAGQGYADPAVVTKWNATAVATIVTDGGKGNATAFVWYAITQAAVHNAVNGITHEHPLYRWDAHGPRGASPAAAAAVAAHDVLLHWFPGSQTRLDNDLASSLAAVPDGVAKDQGLRYGARAAERLIALREGDGQGATTTYPVGTAPGDWQPTPPAYAPALAPWMADLKPFVLSSDDALRPTAPPAIDSAAHQADLAEVRTLGEKTAARSAAQTETAKFFSDTPVGAVQGALRGRIARQHLDISDAAHLLAGVDLAMADAIIATWDAKYAYRTWRPVTEIGGGWSPLIATPPYPEYPAGTPAVYAALATVLPAVTGSGDLDLDITSAAAGVTRHYSDPSSLVRDVVDGRVWAGVHYRTSDVVGAGIGRQAAEQVAQALG